VFQDQGLARESLELLDRARTLASGRASILNNRGIALNLLGRFSEAEEAFRIAVGCPDATAAMHVNLANLLRDRSCWDDAIEAYSYALALGADGATAGLGLAWCQRNVCDWNGTEERAARARGGGSGDAGRPLWRDPTFPRDLPQRRSGAAVRLRAELRRDPDQVGGADGLRARSRHAGRPRRTASHRLCLDRLP